MISMLRISAKGSEDVSYAIVFANAAGPICIGSFLSGSLGFCPTFLSVGLVLSHPPDRAAYIFRGRRGRTGNPVRDAATPLAADRYRMALKQRTGCRPHCSPTRES